MDFINLMIINNVFFIFLCFVASTEKNSENSQKENIFYKILNCFINTKQQEIKALDDNQINIDYNCLKEIIILELKEQFLENTIFELGSKDLSGKIITNFTALLSCLIDKVYKTAYSNIFDLKNKTIKNQIVTLHPLDINEKNFIINQLLIKMSAYTFTYNQSIDMFLNTKKNKERYGESTNKIIGRDRKRCMHMKKFFLKVFMCVDEFIYLLTSKQHQFHQ